MDLIKKTLLLLCSLSLISSCGWHMRGAQNSDTGLSAVNLQATDIYTKLYHSFKYTLEKRNIAISTDANAPTIKLLEENFENRIVSLNTELDPAEIEITLTVRYQLNENILSVQTTQTVRRDKNNASARDNEIKMRQEQMRTELINRILQQASVRTENRENLSR